MNTLLNTDIIFPGLHITLKSVASYININGFHIAFYGIIIALGMIMGYLCAEFQAKRTGQNPELYLDFAVGVFFLCSLCLGEQVNGRHCEGSCSCSSGPKERPS